MEDSKDCLKSGGVGDACSTSLGPTQRIAPFDTNQLDFQKLPRVLVCESLFSSGAGSVALRKRYFQQMVFQSTASSQLLGPHPAPFMVDVTHQTTREQSDSFLLKWSGSRHWHSTAVVWGDFHRSAPHSCLR